MTENTPITKKQLLTKYPHIQKYIKIYYSNFYKDINLFKNHIDNHIYNHFVKCYNINTINYPIEYKVLYLGDIRKYNTSALITITDTKGKFKNHFILSIYTGDINFI